MVEFVVVSGDVVELAREERVDAVVNPTDPWYTAGGGVAEAICDAAGLQYFVSLAELPRIEAGEAIMSSGFDLGCDVIHVVGPVWYGGRVCEEETLERAYFSVLTLAEKMGYSSIAMPAIATGSYGFPCERAAVGLQRAYLRYKAEVAKHLERIYFVLYDEESKKEWESALGMTPVLVEQ